MKWRIPILIAIGIAALIFGWVAFMKKNEEPPLVPEFEVPVTMNAMEEQRTTGTHTMEIASTAFQNGGSIPRAYTCDGAGVNPPFTISGVPEGARSLVLLADDPDVPTSIRPDGMWDHWVVFNIPPTVTVIAEGSEPAGVAGSGTGGTRGYHGPCPPDREHRYFFKLYALNDFLSLPEGATKAQVEAAMKGKVIAEAQLMGRYARVR